MEMDISPLDLLDKTNLQERLEMFFASVHKCKSLGQTSKKRISSAVHSEFRRFGRWTWTEDIDNQLFQVIEKRFVKKIYLNTLFSDNTRSQKIW